MAVDNQKFVDLKNLIDSCTDFEGRYYLLHLYQIVLHSNKPAEQIEPIIESLSKVITDINNLRVQNINRSKALQDLQTHYQELVDLVGVSGLFYKTKQVLLDFCGFIIGLITGGFGLALGSLTMGIADIKNFSLPTGFFIGAFTGFLVGYSIGHRAPHKFFKESEKRSIQHSVKHLADCFESLRDSLEKDFIEEIKNEYFADNLADFDKFLSETHQYSILTIKAPFFSYKLEGSLGHHTFIKFTINNNSKPALIELGLPSDEATDFTQQEHRQTSGKQLIKMWVMHKILHPQYEIKPSNMLQFFSKYKSGVMDCHTYLEKILRAVNEPGSTLERFTPEDTIIGQIIGAAVRFFRPLPEKLDDCTHTSEASDKCAQSPKSK